MRAPSALRVACPRRMPPERSVVISAVQRSAAIAASIYWNHHGDPEKTFCRDRADSCDHLWETARPGAFCRAIEDDLRGHWDHNNRKPKRGCEPERNRTIKPFGAPPVQNGDGRNGRKDGRDALVKLVVGPRRAGNAAVDRYTAHLTGHRPLFIRAPGCQADQTNGKNSRGPPRRYGLQADCAI